MQDYMINTIYFEIRKIYKLISLNIFLSLSLEMICCCIESINLIDSSVLYNFILPRISCLTTFHPISSVQIIALLQTLYS